MIAIVQKNDALLSERKSFAHTSLIKRALVVLFMFFCLHLQSQWLTPAMLEIKGDADSIRMDSTLKFQMNGEYVTGFYRESKGNRSVYYYENGKRIKRMEFHPVSNKLMECTIYSNNGFSRLCSIQYDVYNDSCVFPETIGVSLGDSINVALEFNKEGMLERFFFGAPDGQRHYKLDPASQTCEGCLTYLPKRDSVCIIDSKEYYNLKAPLIGDRLVAEVKEGIPESFIFPTSGFPLVLHGHVVQYDKSGKIISESDWNDGTICRATIYTETGLELVNYAPGTGEEISREVYERK